MQRFRILLLWIVLTTTATLAFAQEHILLITYGQGQKTIEGDNDFRQTIFFQVPKGTSDRLYLRIFDADCGGNLDFPYGPNAQFDTTTRFQLFGGKGAYSAPTIKSAFPDDADVTSGTLIKTGSFQANPFQDNKWYNFAEFYPGEGEEDGENYVFKLVVEGVGGDDGNVFDVAISKSDIRNESPDGLKMSSYIVTAHVPDAEVSAEMPFSIPQGVDQISVHSFDLAYAKVGVETAFNYLPVVTSGQDDWAESKVQFQSYELQFHQDEAHPFAVTYQGGREIPNDATFYLTDNQNQTIPIQLPLYARKPNHRPDAQVDIKTLADCRTIVFDGSRSTDEDGDALEFTWDFGDGTPKRKGVSVAHRYDRIVPYNAELIVSDNSGQVGNSARSLFIILINEPPKAEARADSVVGEPGRIFSFDGSASIDPDGEITRYVWDFGDGSKRETKVSVSHVFKQPGRYQVTLRVEDNSDSPCNSDEAQLTILINAAPVVNIGRDRLTESPNDPIIFDVKDSYDSDGKIANYSWAFGDNSSQETGKKVMHSFDKPGTYKVTLTVTDDSGVANNTATDQLIVRVNDQPTAIAGNNRRVAAGEAVAFDGSASTDRDGEIIDYLWSFGDGGQDTGKKVSHAYTREGTYTVTLTVQDNSNSKSREAKGTLTVIVNAPPVAVAGRDQVVTVSAVQFDGTQSSDPDGEVIRYLWDFGDGTRSSEPSPVHVYGRPGIYPVKLTVTDDSGTSTSGTSDELTVIVNAAPIADAGIENRTGVPGQRLDFDGSQSLDPDGEIASYVWDFGDGQTSSGSHPCHTYQHPGIYTVLLTVRDETGHPNAVDYDETIVRINRPPVADAGGDVFVAPGQVVIFDGSHSYDLDGRIEHYQWRFSDGQTEDASQVERTFAEAGIYSASLAVIDNSGATNARHTDNMSIYVNASPEARLEIPQARPAKDKVLTCDTTIVFDGAASADPDGNILTYSWDFGDETPLVKGIRAIHTYAKADTYPVILTVDDGTGLDNATSQTSVTLEINQRPIAEAGEDQRKCVGDWVLFDASGSTDPEGGLLKYYWDLGDGTPVQEGLNPTHKYEKWGSFQVTLTVKDDSGLPCNISIDRSIVHIIASPVAKILLSPDVDRDRIRANTKVQFDGSQSKDFVDDVVNHFEWDFGDGTKGSGDRPSHIYTEPRKYRVVLTIEGDEVGGCGNVARDEMELTIIPAPVARFTSSAKNNRVAVNTPVQFDASGSSSDVSEIVAWSWDFGDGISGEGEQITHTYTQEQTYSVKLTIEDRSGSGMFSMSTTDFIIVNRGPVAEAGEDQLVGINQVVEFNSSDSKDIDGSIVSYLWNFGDGGTASGVQVQHQYQTSGLFTAILTVKDNTHLENNSDTDTVLVTVNAAPVPSIDLVDWACVGEPIQFSGRRSTDQDGQIVTYHWDLGDGETASGMQVSHTYSTPARYAVTLTVDDGTSTPNSKSATTRILAINHPPTAHAGRDQIVCPGETVTFDASSSTDRDGGIDYYRWNFGDGTEGADRKVTHTYKTPGRYEVRLSVTDNSGTACGLAEDTLVVIVNTPPVAEAGENQVGFVGGAHDAVFFDGTQSYDSDGDPLTYSWDFGDGNSDAGAKVSHTYTKPGKYVVRLRIHDSSGTSCGEARDELTVEVKKR